MTTIAKRAQAFGQTIFSEITALAIQHGAVNLGQGFPDFQPPEFVRQAGLEAMAGPEHQYARGAGSLELARTLAELMGPSFGRELDPLTEVTVTVGATEGLFAAALGLINPGDEVLLLEPFYDSYPADVAIAGGVPRFVPLEPGPGGCWGLDLERLERAFSPRTRAIFLNTPHNPTGKVFARGELERIAALCQQHDTLAICDEVYEQLLFDGRQHLRLASLPGMWERTLTISSAGKSFSVTGWKIGWAIGPAPLSEGLRRIHQWNPFAVATPLQLAVSRVLRQAGPLGYYPRLTREYQDRRDRLVQILAQAGLQPIVPEGTYFVVADFSALGDWAADDVAFCRRLTTEVGVAAIPPSAFYSPRHAHLAKHLARFCFCKQDQTLEAAAERLQGLQRK